MGSFTGIFRKIDHHHDHNIFVLTSVLHDCMGWTVSLDDSQAFVPLVSKSLQASLSLASKSFIS